ncbi:MAG: VPGUxxT family thioredoxin-like (seleno)protein, type 2 [Verrucomicrobiota bacterium]
MKSLVTVSVGLAFVVLLFLPSFLRSHEKNRPEIGDVSWSRDFEGTLAASKESGKPVFILFQELPGCQGCRDFGQTVLTNPQIVEAIETLFEPVLVHNNSGGKDAEILKRYKEPAWNYQVVRFLDAEGKDIIPRRDRVWTTPALAARMVAALEKSGQPVPNYLRALSSTASSDVGTAAFAMLCFWTGEQRLGGIDGVLTTEAGWLDGREVTLVRFDREKLPFETLTKKAESFDCAQKVFTTTTEDAVVAAKSRLKHAALTDSYRAAKKSDQKRQLPGTQFQNLDLSPTQATKVNAFARSNPKLAASWLSPRQLATLN